MERAFACKVDLVCGKHDTYAGSGKDQRYHGLNHIAHASLVCKRSDQQIFNGFHRLIAHQKNNAEEITRAMATERIIRRMSNLLRYSYITPSQYFIFFDSQHVLTEFVLRHMFYIRAKKPANFPCT